MTASSPTASSLAGTARRVTLLCPEPLRASACCVEDALIARGWRVRLEFGAQARRVLLRPARSDARELRILCTAEPLDPGIEAQLRLGVDPEGRGDFQIVLFDTPRAVIEAVERMGGAATRRRRVPGALGPRRGRTYLQHATLVEQQVHEDRNRRWGIATAVAVAIAAVAGIEATPRSAAPVDAPLVRRATDETADDRPRSPTMDEPVLAAVRTALPDDHAAPPGHVGTDEPTIVIEDDVPEDDHGELAQRGPRDEELEAAPLEDALTTSTAASEIETRVPVAMPRVVVPAAPMDLERRRATYTIDPFATPNAER